MANKTPTARIPSLRIYHTATSYISIAKAETHQTTLQVTAPSLHRQLRGWIHKVLAEALVHACPLY